MTTFESCSVSVAGNRVLNKCERCVDSSRYLSGMTHLLLFVPGFAASSRSYLYCLLFIIHFFIIHNSFVSEVTPFALSCESAGGLGLHHVSQIIRDEEVEETGWKRRGGGVEAARSE